MIATYCRSITPLQGAFGVKWKSVIQVEYTANRTKCFPGKGNFLAAAVHCIVALFSVGS